MELSPFRILKEAIKAVPAVKYALGVAGIASVIAIVAGFKIDYRIAVFGTIIMIGLMLLLLIFSNAASPKNKRSLRLPSLVLTWSFLLLILFSTTLLASSFFFSWPQELAFYFPPNVEKINVAVSGSVVNADNQPINDAQVTIDGYEFIARTTESGFFMAHLTGIKLGEIITVRVSHQDYASNSIIRPIKSIEEKFDFKLVKKISE
ncbi:carboxypeptidase-like regulatory domain-containing protein [candidate division KSB1 bacterium]|nr:carboxypeptidase-like regulatory domain-containing protein [candidate division KSB1 bacterium]